MAAEPVKLSSSFLTVCRVRKRFGEQEVLRGVTFEMKHGDVLAVIGPSGSGKSTLLRCLHQLERIDSGAILLDGELQGFAHHRGRLRRLREGEVARQRRAIGTVFQQFNLFPHMTVLENIVEAPVRVQRKSRRAAEKSAHELIGALGLAGQERMFPGRLSGGQQQRAAIARSLALEPSLMLFDEPTSSLDRELVGEVTATLKRVATRGMTMIVVTHDIDFAGAVADRIAFMEDGVIVQEGPAREFLDNPEDQRLQVFLRGGTVSQR